MPFNFAQNELDAVVLYSQSDGTFLVTGSTSTTFGFLAPSAITVTEATFSYAAGTGAVVPVVTLQSGLAASGEVHLTLAPTAASTLVTGTSRKLGVEATSAYSTYVPVGAALAVKVTTTAAANPISGLCIQIRGKRYGA